MESTVSRQETTEPDTEGMVSSDIIPKPISANARRDRWLKRSSLGRNLMLAFSFLVVARAGSALDGNLFLFSQEEEMSSELATSPIFFRHALSWLPQSSSGLKFSMPPHGMHDAPLAAHSETEAVVRELMAFTIGASPRDAARPSRPETSTPHRSPGFHAVANLGDIDPEILKSAIEIPDPAHFGQKSEEKSVADLKSNPFSQEELVELAMMR
ncbi:MAG: hypothetical protein HQL76_06655 [Magnetococcales bacterium]|nr:hypothetical protein [Magnetococcales bacterium]